MRSLLCAASAGHQRQMDFKQAVAACGCRPPTLALPDEAVRIVEVDGHKLSTLTLAELVELSSVCLGHMCAEMNARDAPATEVVAADLALIRDEFVRRGYRDWRTAD